MTPSPVKKLKTVAVARQKKSDRAMRNSIKATKELEKKVIAAKKIEARDILENGMPMLVQLLLCTLLKQQNTIIVTC
jgi:hypothetical protein